MPGVTLEGEDIKEELEEAVQMFNTYFINEYAVMRVDTAGLSEEEMGQLKKELENSKKLGEPIVEQHGTGLNLLIRRNFKEDSEIIRIIQDIAKERQGDITQRRDRPNWALHRIHRRSERAACVGLYG